MLKYVYYSIISVDGYDGCSKGITIIGICCFCRILFQIDFVLTVLITSFSDPLFPTCGLNGRFCPIVDMIPAIPLYIQEMESGTLISIGRNGILVMKSPMKDLVFGISNTALIGFLTFVSSTGSASIISESSISSGFWYFKLFRLKSVRCTSDSFGNSTRIGGAFLKITFVFEHQNIHNWVMTTRAPLRYKP